MAKNEITGDEIATKAVNDLYRAGFDRIFGKNEQQGPEESGPSLLEDEKDDPEPV